MDVLSFGLTAGEACKGGDADFYGRITRLAQRRVIMTTGPLYKDPRLLRHGRPAQMVRAVRELLHDNNARGIPMAVTWLRYCRNHPERPSVERLGIVAITYPAAEIVDVKPVAMAPDDPNSVGSLSVLRNGKILRTLEPVYFPPTTPQESGRNPVVEALSIPVPYEFGGEAYVALRGIEEIVSRSEVI